MPEIAENGAYLNLTAPTQDMFLKLVTVLTVHLVTEGLTYSIPHNKQRIHQIWIRTAECASSECGVEVMSSVYQRGSHAFYIKSLKTSLDIICLNWVKILTLAKRKSTCHWQHLIQMTT
jgi:hypothetical protein